MLKNIWLPLKELIGSFSSISSIDEKIYNTIYKHFQKSTEALPIKKLTKKMKTKHFIPSEKTMTTIRKMENSENRDGPLISVDKQDQILLKRAFYQQIP